MTQQKYKQRPHIAINDSELKVIRKEHEKTRQSMYAILSDCLHDSSKFKSLAKKHKMEAKV